MVPSIGHHIPSVGNTKWRRERRRERREEGKRERRREGRQDGVNKAQIVEGVARIPGQIRALYTVDSRHQLRLLCLKRSDVFKGEAWMEGRHGI